MFVTVDPEHDDARTLGAWVRRFGPGVVGLTGPPARVRAVAAAYRVRSRAAAGGRVDHSTWIRVIDAAGRVRLLFSPRASVDDLAHDLRVLLQEAPAAALR